MLQRTKGRLLLALLVITGLAGTLNNSAISGKERKTSASLMKESRAALLKAVKGLSDAQLNFRPSPDQWSVKECVYHIAVSEKNIRALMAATMKQPANPDKRAEIKFSDEEFVAMMKNRESKVKTGEMFEPKNTPYLTLEAALADFKASRNEHIKYIRSTTEDLRNHVVQMPFGWVDCYQLTLMIGAHTERHLQQIGEIKADPRFPKQ